jgi:hypothetical protein
LDFFSSINPSVTGVASLTHNMANPSDVDDIAGAAPASDESVQFSAAGICGLSLDASEAEETAVDISEDIIDDKKGKGELCELWRVDKVWKGICSGHCL